MSTLLRVRIPALGAALLLAAPGLNANPLKYPTRIVNAKTVDLKPLFKWWGNHNGPRPLVAWGQVTGSVVATNSLGWIVQGHFTGTTNLAGSTPATAPNGGKFILKNPPLSDRAEFERLLANYKAVASRRAQVAAQETNAKNTADELKREQQASGVHGRGAGRVTRNAQRADAQVKAQLKTLDQQLADAQKKLDAYPNPAHYELDCLALGLGQTYQGLPVYDHGVPLN